MEAPKIVTGLVILSIGLVGCRAKFTSVKGQKDQPGVQQQAPDRGTVVPFTPPPIQTAKLPPPITPNICETTDDETIGSNRIVVRRTVTFYQGKQMVWRKDCSGKVISKTWENLGSNVGKVIRVKHPGARVWNATNRSTCATMAQTKIVKRSSSAALDFPVSIVASDNALQVRKGRNIIDFEVTNSSGELVRGTLILTVKITSSNGGCIVFKAKNCPAKEQDPFSFTSYN